MNSEKIPETITGTVRQKLESAEEGTSISVNIVLHAGDWVKLGLIMKHNLTNKGDRRFRTLSGAIWVLVSKSYNGTINALKRLESKKDEPVKSVQEDNDEPIEDEEESETGAAEFGYHQLRIEKK